MKVLVFQHTPEESPGTLLEWLSRREISHQIHHWYSAAMAPDPGAFDWLVILGGPMNLDQESEYPWLREEKKFIRAWLATGKPVLGICLGGQLLAQALGGKVAPNHVREIGFQKIQRTTASYPAFARWPASLAVYQYHEDAFTLPPGCVSLLTSIACQHQAFALDRKTLALQFHPESTHDWIRLNGPSIAKVTGEEYVQTPAETEAVTANLLPPMTECFFQMLDDFVESW